MAMVVDVSQLKKAIAAEAPYGLNEQELTGVVIDNRKVEQGNLFVGLPGEKTHGQRFAAQALAAGAGAVIVEDLAQAKCDGKPNVLLVPSAEKALQQAARKVRQMIDITLIGITGTNGKTTTKEVVASVLEQSFGSTHASGGNLNNHLGLPMSLLSIPNTSQYGVFELGMSNPGEIDFIANILKPQIGIITNIGAAHLETMGTIEAIVDAKAELIAHLPENGLLLLNADCTWADELASRHQGRVKKVGVTREGERRNLDAELIKVTIGLDFVEGLLQTKEFGEMGRVRLPIAGVHIATSFLFAVLVALELGAEPKNIPAALMNCRPAWGRMETKEYGGLCIINDGYNANPASMEAALRHMAALDNRVFVVLGEMLELGHVRKEAHENVARLAAKLLPKEQIFLLGQVYSSAKSLGLGVYEEIDEIAKAMKPMLRRGDTLLVKASRGVGIERILPLLFPKEQ